MLTKKLEEIAEKLPVVELDKVLEKLDLDPKYRK